MPLVSTLQGGPLTSKKTYNITNAKADEMITAFIYGWAGEMPEGTVTEQSTWKLKQAHQKLIDYFRAEVQRNSQFMAQDEIEVIRQRIATETELPEPTEE